MSLRIYEINTAVWFGEQPWVRPGKPDLAGVPDDVLDSWAAMGFDVIWFLGVWKIGAASREICLASPELTAGFERESPGSVPDHVAGSPFSIVDYSLRPEFGGEETLRRLRAKLHAHGMRLMLDFVPNHLAVDHPWVTQHPERLVRGSEGILEREPRNYFRVPGRPAGILAHGRDPYFDGWTDTAQINIFNSEARAALTAELLRVVGQCDAVRCDMAMLATNDVFRRTWGDLSIIDYPSGEPPEFWTDAIAAVKRRYPESLFLAEVYWGLEPQLQAMGFDLTYDKTLYDRLRAGDGASVRQVLSSPLEAQRRMVRFIENHDESRAAAAFGERARAAATLVSALPGAILYHEGQFEGRARHVPVQLSRRAPEPPDESLRDFYERLLRLTREPVVRHGEFRPLDVRAAWEENSSFRGIVACWRSLENDHRLVVANVANHQAQGYAAAPLDRLAAPVIEFRDLMSDACYYRSRSGLDRKGLYLDIGPGAYHFFRVQPAPEGRPVDPYNE